MTTSGSLLLDTTIVIAHFRQDEQVTNRLLAVPVLFLSSVALGELHYGARKSAAPAKKLAQLQAFLPWVNVLTVTESTAKYYGEVQLELTAAGTPIPQNDMWIAAAAREHHLPIATRDAHFSRISGLHVLNW